MIIYKNSAAGFVEEVENNKITDMLEASFIRNFGKHISPSEKRSTNNSMQFMCKVIRRASIAENAGILIEYNLPATNKRIDFVVAGEDELGNKNFVIIELKQWESANSTSKEELVETYLNGSIRETTHPSYQATSYKLYLKDYNENIYNGNIKPISCAYLHNYKEGNPEPLRDEIYTESLEESPLFFKDDNLKLEEFLHRHVGKGNGIEILYKVEDGQIRPSKKLIDHVSSIFKGNNEFILLDEQKVAYENALYLATKTSQGKKVLIIKGGPGTGKSVISMNLIPGFLEKKLNAVFVAPNASFRNVMVERLSKNTSKKRLTHLFKGSSAFVNTPENTYDVIVVDEAHRLKDKRAYMYHGENQVEDLIKAGRTTIFFVDDNQMVRPDDIGSTSEIKRVAKWYGAEICELELQAQFRCAGSDGYINWLDDVLHIRQTGNFNGWDKDSFDFRIFDNPRTMFDLIRQKQKEGSNARMLAGYAWKWSSAQEGNPNGEIEDVEIKEYDFRMPWNSRRTGTTWAIDPQGINEIGCIHTTQGLEFDYVGVIVGNEFRFNPETLEYYVDWFSYKDSSGKKGLKEDPEKLVLLVKNIYKTLMSRGMKGCYVYFQDKKVKEYFESRI